MTPISPRRGAPADAAATDTDASASTPISAADAGTEPGAPISSDAAADTGTPPVQDPAQWLVYGRASLGAADHGGRNGNIFAYNPISQLGDWIRFDVAAGVLRDINEGNVRFRLGGSLGYTRYNGGENTSGSHLNLFSISPRAELDWRRVWGTGPVAGPSRIGIDFGLGVGFGSSTVDGGFQLHDQLGFALSPRVDLNLINARLGGLEIGLDIYAGTSAILGNQHNSAFADIGGQLTFRSPLDGPAPIVEEACSTDRRGEVVQRIQDLQAQSEELRTENAENALFLESIRTQLEAQGISSEDLVASLRRGYTRYLENREENPIADAAERDRLALERFPDDFDPYAWPEVARVDVPEPLPLDCEELDDLRTLLEDERADLREQKGLIDGLVRMGLTRLGVNSTAAPHLIRAITRLSEIHFITARPQGAPDRVSVRASDIAPINAAADAWGRDHRGEVRPLAEIEAAFSSIFPRTRRAPTDTTPGRAEEYSPSLAVIQQIAETLRSPEMRGSHFYVVGHTDSRGDDEMNARLSMRRAQAIRDALIFFGVDPDMITPLGRGESQLVYYYDQPAGGGRDTHRMARAEVTMLREDGIRGGALLDEIRGRQATNRRIEMFVCVPNTTDEVCSQLDAEVRGTGTTAVPPPVGDAASPVQTVEAPEPARARRRRARTETPTERSTVPAGAEAPPRGVDMDFSGAGSDVGE